MQVSFVAKTTVPLSHTKLQSLKPGIFTVPKYPQDPEALQINKRMLKLTALLHPIFALIPYGAALGIFTMAATGKKLFLAWEVVFVALWTVSVSHGLEASYRCHRHQFLKRHDEYSKSKRQQRRRLRHWNRCAEWEWRSTPKLLQVTRLPADLRLRLLPPDFRNNGLEDPSHVE